MSASKASSLRALRTLAAGSKQVPRRHLHMTGPAEFPSPALVAGRPSASTKDLSAAMDAASKRPSMEPSETSTPPVRHFNTSRSLKAVNDSSTIDFMYIPDFDPDLDADEPMMRVPLLPQTKAAPPMYDIEAHETPVMEPQIFTVAADGTHISAPAAMSDVHDNTAMNIDFEGMANRATKTVTGKSVEEQVGTVRQVWNGLLDDLFGPKASKA
ncbi:hypothetical protein H2201_004801 [Coniosporium apollinis]|uniref:Uncharacterized protein n=2 Tax=Coniosporium TaxID=2810619 RepID=A0ABQ9NV02_9PEZI|nr:hypothetical protein H2199_004789 [Cladosporium sp. JES 115]KAJ9665140.1 hypothetical protein H2201_004801 [Coniosporium apollinis]